MMINNKFLERAEKSMALYFTKRITELKYRKICPRIYSRDSSGNSVADPGADEWVASNGIVLVNCDILD